MIENPYIAPNYGEMPEPKEGMSGWLKLFLIVGGGLLLIALLLSAVRTGREPARRTMCRNNLKQIALALQNYEDVHGALPPAYTVDADGKPLHSWRTLILPYVEEAELYKKIDLTKAWDDPANAEAFKTVIHAYSCPSAIVPEGHTTYMASAGEGGCFHPTKPRPLSEITDGLAKTLMVIEVTPEHAVHWMSPLAAGQPPATGVPAAPKFTHPGGVNAAFCDGSVQFLSDDMPADERRAMITIAGGD